MGAKNDGSTTSGKYAREFQKWIDSFHNDIQLFVHILKDGQAPEKARRIAATGLNYLVKQMDFVPDHYKPLGIIDDCIVLRVLADMGAEQNAELQPKQMKAIFKLANDCDILREYLGDIYRPLENEIRLMTDREVRRRSPEAIVNNESVRAELLHDVEQEMTQYKSVEIKEPERAERELLSYFRTKLGLK